ncbi:hypothetical protein [Asaia bogorensis]|uniref:hypothetical protein n=1 Tax=Asaia bogorensis TaxID=91915 RepID=UPI000EFD3011|nr:hypothetical protein [Asaia bogorensis]
MMDRAQALTAVLRRETGVRRDRRNAEAVIVNAERNVLASDDEDSAVEGFVNWLPEARAAIDRARLAEREVAIDVAVAYQAYIQAKMAVTRSFSTEEVPATCEPEETNQGGETPLDKTHREL